MARRITHLLLAFSLIAFPNVALALQGHGVQVELDPAAEADRDARMQWWHEAKFGMFVHWGIYSVVGGQYKGQELPNSAEWMMNKGRIPIAEYEQYANQFNPTKFDAVEFVARAKDAGMKYLVITAKHHDGFSMFASKATKYNVVDATPFGRDIMKELAVACRDAGIRFGFYYSQAQDWHHPGGFGNNWDKTLKKVSKEEYVREKAAPEVKQLLTEYGTVGIFWWDTPRKMSKEAYDSLFLQTSLQPGVITNDRLGKDYPGDHTTFERKIPAKAPASKNWEVCMPISGSWGYKKSDKKFKSTETLIRNLADITSKGGNYLLNVSPTGEGTLLPQAIERLKAIGDWMDINSESIYGTTASPFSEFSWGRCTKKSYDKGTTFYFHIFDWPEDGKLVIPGLNNKVNMSYMLADMKPLEFQKSGSDVVVSLPSEAPDKIDSVLVMHVGGPLDITGQNDMLAADGSLVLKPKAAYMHNNEGAKEIRVSDNEVPNIAYWTDPNAWVEWSVKFEQAGTYDIVGEVAVEGEKTRLMIGMPEKHAAAEVGSTGGYGNYKKVPLGTIEIEAPGTYPVQVIPDADNWQPMNVRMLELKLQ